MNATRMSAWGALAGLAAVTVACWAWSHHAHAWDLGGASPVLGYDAAQYAVAARELAEHGRLATTFALPIELSRHREPPWPLALVQPGLVVAEAALLKLDGLWPAASLAARLARREWVLLAFPVACFIATALLLARATGWLFARHAPGVSAPLAAAAAATVAIAFALDPEAQHFASGGFTEPPFTLGLLCSVTLLAFGVAAERPLLFGLALGLTGAFRGNMLWLAPALAFAAAATAPAGRARVFAWALLGFALPLAPWWIYKWRAFGSPAWDLSALSVWDGIGSRTWFSINHLPQLPDVPSGWSAVRAIAGKMSRNLVTLGIDTFTGPRALWVGALAVVSSGLGLPRALVVTAPPMLALLALSLVAAAASVPLWRYLFPVRAIAEAAGLLATWTLVERSTMSRGARRTLQVALATLAIVWGGLQTVRGASEASAVASERGVPSSAAMADLAVELSRRVPAGEAVMSNLGPVLAWHADRPVLHLALTPADLDACRERLPFHHVLLAFRAPAQAWTGWDALLAHPESREPAWNIASVERGRTRDGFMLLWIEMGPLEPRLAMRR